MSIFDTKTSTDNGAKLLTITVCMLYFTHALFAVATHRELYGDASWFLVRIVSEGHVTNFYSDFFRDFYYSRFVAYTLTQLPTVIALGLGIDNAQVLSWVLGATFFSHKIISIWLCYCLLPAERKMLVVFPALAVFAGTINSDVYIVTETHLAVSFLWPMLIAVTFKETGTLAFLLATSIAAVLVAFVYESMAFFAPILLLILAIRARSAKAIERRNMFVVGVFLIGATLVNWLAIILPRDPTNKSAFTDGLLKLFGDTLLGVSHLHVGPLVSLFALGLIALLLLVQATKQKWIYAVVIPLVAFSLAIIPPVHFIMNTQTTVLANSISDRGFGGLLIQFALITLYLHASWVNRSAFGRNAKIIYLFVTCLALGQVGWQLLASYSWQNALGVASRVLASKQGIVICASENLRGAGRGQIEPGKVLCGWWVMPLSIILAPRWDVSSLLLSAEQFRPFDPFVPQSLPKSQLVPLDFTRYVAAIDMTGRAIKDQPVSFTSTGTGISMLREGFSWPEDWGVWTDGDRSRLLVCGFDAASSSRVKVNFELSPFVPEQRPELGVRISVGGHFVQLWTFSAGQQVVQRSVAFDSGRIDQAGCVDMQMEIDSPRSPMELGISEDPRKLGVALISLQIDED